jgi:SecD/SecF fusion protein
VSSRTRNLSILGLVGLLLVLAALVELPGTPLSKPTKLGLDLKGGTELVYQAQPTPKVPKVTPQAIKDAIETIRKRTDVLGVSEPEIQQAGADQISIGLPAVDNAKRAIQQVGTTAQLQFYDWEPNVLGPRGPNQPFTGSTALFQAVQVASKQKPKAEPTDIPPGAPKGLTKEQADRQNDTSGAKYYLFGPDKKPIAGPAPSCKDLLADYEPVGKPGSRAYPKGTQCSDQLRALGRGGPPAGSQVLKVPQGIVVIEAEKTPKQPDTVHRYYVLEDDSELSGSDIKNPKQNFDQRTNEPIVTMEFTDKGRNAFAAATKREAKRGSEQILPPGTPQDAAFQRFAITLDNRIVSLATIDFRENPEGIDGRTGAQINGIGSIQETQDLAESLRIGALPVDLKLISQTQVSATLGQQALHQGLLAGAAGLLLTILFLLLFYRVLGGVATGALLIYAVFLYALVKLIPITLTLPGIAGLVLTLAVAADANIVMYERIKEEVRAGRSIPAAISGGYSKALKTIIDANVVTIGVAFILFTLATAGVKGFAFTLGIGTIVSLFTAVLATSAILGSMARSRVLRSRQALGSTRERVGWRFDFMGASKWFFSMSGTILAAGAFAIAGLGINFGIDFESGTRITTPLNHHASVAQVRDVLSPLGYGDAKIQQVNDKKLGTNVVQIATSTLQPDQVSRVQDALDSHFGVRTRDFSSSSVGPTFGAQIARTAVIAIVASLLLISLYIALRFEPKFAVPVLIALFHDLLITAGVYALTNREVSTATVAALLTILGYSLYDTIIVFDRIRENVPRMPRATFSQIVNRSMSEVLTRSLATSFSTLLPIGALLFFGGQTLRDFAFALLVGVASGTYSSIFIASPVLTEWKERESIYRRRRRLVMEENDGLVPAYATVTTGDGAAPEREPTERRRRATRRARPAPRDPAAPPQAPAPEQPAVATEPKPAPPPEPSARPAEDGGEDGDGAAPRRGSSTTTTGAGTGPAAPKPKAKPKPKRQRQRKRHGRR